MSIASEIQDLQTNLQAAKTAVTVKGGTIGNTGLSGLASEIATIPTGGSLANYGSITLTDDSVITLANESDYIELTLGKSASTLHINGTTVIKNNIKSVVIADGVQYIPDKFCYGCSSITSVTIPSSVHFIGDNVFVGNNITTANFSLDNVLYIGNSFLLNNSNFNTPISLPKVKEISDSFLQGCISFNSTITLNNNAETIGVGFLYGCTSYDQPFTIPSGLIDDDDSNPPIGGQFMYNCKNFVGPLDCTIAPGYISGTSSQMNQILATNDTSALMYTTGITLTGTYASYWKTKFADRDSTPYRKLIVGS